MKKRIMALFLSGILAASLLTGCGGTGSDTGTNQNEAADSETNDGSGEVSQNGDDSVAGTPNDAVDGSAAGCETL